MRWSDHRRTPDCTTCQTTYRSKGCPPPTTSGDDNGAPGLPRHVRAVEAVGCGFSGGAERTGDCAAVPDSAGGDFGTSDEFRSRVTGYWSSPVSRTRHRAPASRHRRLDLVTRAGISSPVVVSGLDQSG